MIKLILTESYTLDIYSIYNDVIRTFSRKMPLLLFIIQLFQYHNSTFKKKKEI